MTSTANQFIKQAQSYLGIVQGSPKHQELIAAYNRVKPLPQGYAVKLSDQWCDIFVTVIADQTGLSAQIGRECGVKRHVDIFKARGIWLGRTTPKRGDIVTYDWDKDGWPDHIGIVTAIHKGSIQTIEGNTSGHRVAEQIYHSQAAIIHGYARPKYNAESSASKRAIVKATAERWATGETIDNWVKGRSFEIMGHRERSGNKEYLLVNKQTPIGWLKASDLNKVA